MPSMSKTTSTKGSLWWRKKGRKGKEERRDREEERETCGDRNHDSVAGRAGRISEGLCEGWGVSSLWLVSVQAYPFLRSHFCTPEICVLPSLLSLSP